MNSGGDPILVFCSCGRLVHVLPAVAIATVTIVGNTFDVGPVCEKCRSLGLGVDCLADVGIEDFINHLSNHLGH